jgi:hypothetical protein
MNVDQRAQLELNGRLEPGESLIWTGVPRQGVVLRAFDAFMIPFSLLWGGFAFFWEATVVVQGAPIFAVLWGIPFVVMGLYLIVGRFFSDARVRANTFYGLTDRRVVILSGVFTRTVTSLPLRTLSDISVVERSDGSGTIHLGRPQPFAAWYAGMQWPGRGSYQTPSFDLIRDVQAVYRQLMDKQRNAA